MERGHILLPWLSPGMRVTAWQIKWDPKNCILNLTPARLHHLRCWSKGRKTSCKVFYTHNFRRFQFFTHTLPSASSCSTLIAPPGFTSRLVPIWLHHCRRWTQAKDSSDSGHFLCFWGQISFSVHFLPWYDSQCKISIIKLIFLYCSIAVLKLLLSVSCQPMCKEKHISLP